MSNTRTRITAAILQPSLLAGLKSLRGSVDNNPSLPVLEHVLIQGKADYLTLSASNLEVTQQVRVSARVDNPEFEVTAPYKMLTELVSLLNDERIDLEVSQDEAALVVKQHGSRSRFFSMDVDAFPPVKPFDPSSATLLCKVADAAELKAAVGHVSKFCESPSKNRYAQAHEYLKLVFDQSGLTVSGANKYAASSAHLPIAVMVENVTTVYVSPKAFDKGIAALASDDEQGFSVFLADEKTLALTNKVRTILIQVVEDMKFNLPTFTTVATGDVNYTDIASALKVAKREKALHLDITNDSITVAEGKSRQIAVPINVTWKQVAPVEQLMLIRNLSLNLLLESALNDFERGLRWRKGTTKKQPLTVQLHLMIDERNAETVIGVCGRNTLDVFGVSLRLDTRGKRWHSYKKMLSLRTRYQKAYEALQTIPPQYHDDDVNWWDVPANEQNYRAVKITHSNICRDIRQFVVKNDCWTEKEIKSVDTQEREGEQKYGKEHIQHDAA